MKRSSEPYVPALGFRWLTALYDPLLALTTRERTFKAALLESLDLQPGVRLLDLACGTGTLAIQAKQRQPDVDIAGIDGDPAVLGRARRKAEAAGVTIDFREAMSDALPFADASFDGVASSLFFHHLLPDQKRRTLQEVRRVLRPGGILCVADWGKSSGALMRLLFYTVQLLDGFPNTIDHVMGRLPDFFREAGMKDVSRLGELRTVYGTLALHQARNP